MKALCLLLVAIIVFSVRIIAAPGDTTIVQTLSFNDITKRRGFYQFPDASAQYRKILMYYTLKCDPATAQDGYNCGEWDYLTYNYVYDHTGILDSNLLSSQYFTINGTSPDTLVYTTQQPYTFYNVWQYYPVYDNVITESEHTVDQYSVQINHPFGTNRKTSRAQYLWLASELSAAGVVAGEINKIRLNVGSLGEQMNYLQIRMKNSSLTQLTSTSYEKDGFTVVYHMNTNITASGYKDFDFLMPFEWDGSSNIAIDFSFSNSSIGDFYTVYGDSTSFQSGVYSSNSDGYLSFSGPDYVDVPGALFADLDSAVTISFWSYGDPVIQPQNDYAFEGVDENNARKLNVHLPWSNGNIYWDAGNDGSGYDRIDKPCSALLYKGTWTHWAFTKDISTGYMRIYLNGSAWDLGTGNFKDMSGINRFKIGSNYSGGGSYDGYINEFRIWNTVLSTQTIKDWRYKDLDPTHPNYSNLIGYYRFNDGTGTQALDEASGGFNGSLFGLPEWKELKGEDLYRNLTPTNLRPTVTFIQGSYTMHIDSLLFTDSVAIEGSSVLVYGDSVLLPLPSDTLTVWQSGYAYVYENGVVVDSVIITASDTLIQEQNDYWSEPFEIIERYEIGRYITPYGIGLDLGPDGFTWIYDVTDYAFLLHDSVDFSAGNLQELIDVKFVMIEGTPAREVVQMDRIWGASASYYYKDLDDDVVLNAKTLPVHPQAESFKIKTRLTGHGHNSNDSYYPHCCEWKDNTHYLYVNGNQVNAWKIWQYTECAQNPVFPQGGTWPGSREGWCPGDVVGDTDFEIADLITSDSVTIDYDITSVPLDNLGMGWGNYVVAMHLFQYGPAPHTLDAELYDVVSPNNRQYYQRVNPICTNPKVVIRNSGATQLNELNISYQTAGGPLLQYQWTGALDFMEIEEVILPVDDGSFWSGGEDFVVWVSDPNNQQDQNNQNDEYRTSFTLPDTYNEDGIIIELKTNNLPGDNSYTLTDVAGNIIRSASGFAANTTYFDTVQLAPGCYELYLFDSGGDGLSYWAYSAQGTGYMRIKRLSGGTLKNFESEFGMEIKFAFAIDDITRIHDVERLNQVAVYPNPVADNMYVDLGDLPGNINVQVFDAYGKEIYYAQTSGNDGRFHTVDLSDYSNGMYVVRVTNGTETYVNKVVKSDR